MTDFDDFDTQADEREAELLTALIRAYREAAEAIDIDALADAIASGDDELVATVLNIDEGLHSGLDTALNDAFFFILLGGIVIAMKRFASRYRSRVDTAQQGSQLRAELRRNVIEPLSRRANEAAQATLDIMRTTGASAREIAIAVRQSIGMAPDQARSVAHLRRALQDALLSKEGIITATGITITPSRAKTLKSRYQAYLNAAQRSALAKASSGEINQATNEALIDRHVKALVNFRQSVIARQEAARSVHLGEYLAFRQGKANRTLPRTARRFWRTVGDERVRVSHRAIPGMNAEGVDVGQPFQTPLGPFLYPPCEVNCRCRTVVRWPDTETLALAA